MNIEDKIKELNITKLLIVDDTKENIIAAKNYFSEVESLAVEYATSEKEAIKKIKKAYVAHPYSLVISDLEMETAFSGLEVCSASIEHLMMPIIATGHNYNKPLSAAHGPVTFLKPSDKSSETIKGRKSDPLVWEGIFEKSLDYIATHKEIYESLKRYKKFVKTTLLDKNLVDTMIGLYKKKVK